MNREIATDTVTFIFTDIEGSARRWEADRSAMNTAMRVHNEILKSAIEAEGGRIFRHVGDGVCAAFTSPNAAVKAALEMQLALAEHDWSPFDPLKVRVALHTSPFIGNVDDDANSPALILCARLLSTAHGGQVLLSEATVLEIHGESIGDAIVRDLGLHRLKDLTRFEHIYLLLHPDLPADFPPLMSLNVSHNLPAQLITLIGRADDARVLQELIKKHRVVTVVGAGGIGKTQLALEVAAAMLDQFRDGVWLVSLGDLEDPTVVAQAAAAALGIQDESGRPPEDTDILAEVLRSKNLLLLLDNCEHLVEACALLVETLAAGCPHICVLVTSQQPLRLPGEKVWALNPLAFPSERVSTASNVKRFPAVQLFLERARDVAIDFSLDDYSAPPVAKICRSLDGLPLAIELAATRVNALSAEEIAAGLDDRFRLLNRGRRGGPARQQTLHSVVQWSYDLLDDKEQVLFARLSVFTDGASLEAIEAVTYNESFASVTVADLLASLVDRSLVRLDRSVGGAPRYRMLETLRHFGADRLRSRGEDRDFGTRHGEYYLRLAETAAPELRGARQLSCLDRLKHEQGNFRTALSNSFEHGPELGVRLAGSLWWLWFRGGLWSEGSRWLERALATNAGTQEDRLRVICGAALLAALENRYDQAETLVREGEDLGTQADDRWSLAWLTMVRGEVGYYKRDFDAVEAACDQALLLFGEVDDSWGMAWATRLQGQAMGSRGQLEEAASLHERGLRLFRSVGDDWGISWELYFLGAIARSTGDYEKAGSYYQDALRFFRHSDDRAGVAHTLQELAELARTKADIDSAAKLYEESLVLLQAVGDHHCSTASLTGLAIVAHDHGNQDQALARLTESIEICGRLHHAVGAAWAFQAMARVVADRGDADQAALLLGSVLALRESADAPLSGVDSKALEDLIARVRSALGPARFEAERAKGKTLDLEGAVDIALETIAPLHVRVDDFIRTQSDASGQRAN